MLRKYYKTCPFLVFLNTKRSFSLVLLWILNLQCCKTCAFLMFPRLHLDLSLLYKLQMNFTSPANEFAHERLFQKRFILVPENEGWL